MVAAFVTFGLFWGSWAVMLFNIQHTFSLNDAQLGVLLAVAIAVAGASSAVMAHLADRVGARRLLWIALFAWSVLLCVLALTREKWAFATVLVLVEVAGGSIDTAMNAEASHRLVGNPSALVRLHALFNAGALTGAAVAALVIHAGVSWRWVWPGVAVVALVIGVWALVTDPGTALSPAQAGGAGQTTHPLRRLRRDGLLVLLLVFALAEVTEGGVDTWGVLYLRNHLATGVLLGAGAYVVGQLMAATTRRRRVAARPPHHPQGPDRGRLRGGRWHPPRVGLARGRRRRTGPRPRRGRSLAVLAARHEHGEPPRQPGRERRGHLHGRRIRGLGGRRSHRRVGLAIPRPRPRAPGPGPGIVRRRRVHLLRAPPKTRGG